MPKQIRCESCGITLLAFESLGPTPIGRDDCPNCNETDFDFDG